MDTGTHLLAQKTVLITGGSGFFGEILKRFLLDLGNDCISVDLQQDDMVHPRLKSYVGDIREADFLNTVFSSHRIDVIFHCAAMLAHEVKSESTLWSHNVDGTYRIASMARKYGVPRIVYTSTNCLWGRSFGRPIKEEDQPEPIEVYGKSKLEGERILLHGEFAGAYACSCIRTPTIIDSGRLGLLAILFRFIDEGRRVWVVGKGENRYQFIYAPDLARACAMAAESAESGVFNVGSENVTSMRETFQYVIDKAATGARIAFLPKRLTLTTLRLCHWLRVSPLGPYQYNMIAEDFSFDTSKIKRHLGWCPTLSNQEMLWNAYEYYHSNKSEIEHREKVSAHKRPARMGIINLVRWFS